MLTNGIRRNQEFVQENEAHKILSDFQILTDHRIQVRNQN